MLRSTRIARAVVFLAVIALLLAACGDDDSSDAAGEAVSVADAIDSEGSVEVTGYLFVLDDGTVVLAELLGESSPPKALGASITVEGLSLDSLDLEQAPADSEMATAQWTDSQVTLTGTMAGGVLTEAATS